MADEGARDEQAAEESCTCAAAVKAPEPCQTGAPRKVGVQEVRRLGSGTSGHEGGSGGRARLGRGEELRRRIRVVWPVCGTWPGPLGKRFRVRM